ncbi:hypothetical protein PLESTF_001138400 [Pleodorina starrii]|nr:hypothetical protein PLESTM_001307100 [Pleodorina starrii]GLC71588.1 hypothetical protein PLESTF_001138400 [Pleodorina starrii]
MSRGPYEQTRLASGAASANLLKAMHIMLSWSGNRSPSLFDGGRNPGFVTAQLRETCRAFRDVYDQTVQTIFFRTEFPAGPSPEEISTTIRKAVARGCRPTTVVIGNIFADVELLDEQTCNFLSNVARAASVDSIRLQRRLEVTDAVARAVAEVSPKLSRLAFDCPCTRAVAGAGDGGSVWETDPNKTAALRLMLQLAGPRLRDLRMNLSYDYWPPPTPHPLSYCTALTKLDLQFDNPDMAADPSLMRTLSCLTSLRDLSLNEGGYSDLDAAARQARAPELLESCLSPLTALTRLDIGLCCLQHWPHRGLSILDRLPLDEILAHPRYAQHPAAAAQLLAAVAAEWRALVAAARCMPGLRELCTPAQAVASDLASLTALTHLHVGAIVLQTASEPGPAALGPPLTPVHDLPPQLQRLTVNMPLMLPPTLALRQSPSAVLAGAPKISLLVVQPYGSNYPQPPWSLKFQGDDVDEEGRLTVAAAAAMRRAVSSLVASFDFGCPCDEKTVERGVEVEAINADWTAVYPPADGGPAAGAGGPPAPMTHCGSWLGALTELRPLGLRLTRFQLSREDMLGVCCFVGLKELHLRECGYDLPSLPLLAAMPALERLALECGEWAWESWEERVRPDGVAVMDVFYALVEPAVDGGARGAGAASRLRSIRVFCDGNEDKEWLQGVLEPVVERAAQRRPDYLELKVHVDF